MLSYVDLEKATRKRGETPTLLKGKDLMASVQSLCESKADEFRLYGYEDVTGAQIWECISENYKHRWPSLNRLVNDILSLKANRFMNWLMLSVYKEPQ